MYDYISCSDVWSTFKPSKTKNHPSIQVYLSLSNNDILLEYVYLTKKITNTSELSLNYNSKLCS